jgi:hypothetical protein
MIKSYALAIITCIITGMGSGCRIVSPILLETPSSKSRVEAMPVALGIKAPDVSGSHRVSNIMTYQTLGIMATGARLPRRDETDYINKSITDALRANGTFQYIYATPFDRQDVDLVLSVKLRSCKLDNSNYGTIINHCQMIPIPPIGQLISLGMLVGVIPMEQFSVNWKIDFELATRDGKIIKTYSHACDEQAFVNMWKQPFANYMWYESIFLKNFTSAVATLTKGVEKDRAEILQAVSKGG